MTQDGCPSSDTGRRGVTGDHTVRHVPIGATSITPYIGVPDTGTAITFCQHVFDARVIEVTRVHGVVVHAHLDFGNGYMHLEEPNPESGLAGPPADGATSFSLGFYCEDVDTVLGRAQTAGAEVLGPVVTFASGDRFVAVRDPDGIRWSIMSRVEDLSEAASAERIATWAGHDRMNG